MFFLFKKLIGWLLLPPASALLLAVAGLLLLRHKPRAGRALAWAGVLALFVLSLPPVSTGLMVLLCDSAPLDLNQARTAQALVVLGGGVRRNAPEYGGDTLNWLTLERVRYAAKLARETGLPVLVTGGRVYGKGRPEALVMQEVLEKEYAVPVRWVEPESRNTHENAFMSATLLKRDKIARVVLVTHGVDARRARREFSAAGIDVIPAPTDIPSISANNLVQLWPSANALLDSAFALHEILGNVATTLGLSGA